MAFPPSPFPASAAPSAEAAEGVWRRVGPPVAALAVLLGAAPGLARLPPVDRDEARFAQASAQMLETGDPVDIRFQDAARNKKPVGIHWLQAASVMAASSVERREIWAYRLPSILAAMAAACAWGAQALFDPRRAVLAGVILGCTWLLASEGGLAKTDAALCAAVTLSMAGLCRTYVRAAAGEPPRPGEAAAFWIGLAAGLLIKGPVAPLLAVLTLGVLAAADRRMAWMTRLNWRWGLIFTTLVVGPWAAAITVSTDGAFWSDAATTDVIRKMTGAQERHAAPPFAYLLLSPLLIFPAACLLPAALVWGWRRRGEAGARFVLAWLLPGWLFFEAMPTKLPNYVLPLCGALAILSAGALSEPIGRWSRWIGGGLSLLASGAIAVGAVALAVQLGQGLGWSLATGALALLAGAAGAIGVIAEAPGPSINARAAGLIAAGVFGVAAHVALTAGLLPALQAAWPSSQAAKMVARAGLDPRNGVTPGPVAVAGYAEPSLVFLLGTDLDLGDGVAAAQALEVGRPALVEARQQGAFLQRLAQDKAGAQPVGTVQGLDYSDGRQVALTLWRPKPP